MPERDWAKDWELCERARQVPIICNSSLPRPNCLYVPAYNEYHRQLMKEAREALPYWLRRVRELEAENRRLKDANADLGRALMNTICGP